MRPEFKMIKIQIVFILCVIISDANAGRLLNSMNSVSREVSKLFKPRTRSVRNLPLQEDLKKDEDAKIGEEFEIALATERLGFVYCDIKQEPFMGRFVKEYLKISQGHFAKLQTLVPRKMTRAEGKIFLTVLTVCRNYLLDDVLWDSGLRLDVVDENVQLVEAVERFVHFDYFSVKPFKFTTLQCPFKMVDQPEGKVQEIFFTAHGSTQDENGLMEGEKKAEESKENPLAIGRPYYVFASYTHLDVSKFKILMRTVQQDPQTTFAAMSPPRTDGIKLRICDNPQKCPIHLYVRPERFNDGFRLFGKDAEAAFLTERFRFFNKSYKPSIIHRFLDTVLEMKKGYEILSYHEWLLTFLRDESGDLSISDINIPSRFDCRKYVRGAKSLQKYIPIFQADDNIDSIQQVVIKIPLKISETKLVRTFYQCPVTFAAEEYSGKATVNVIPITYRDSEKYSEHAFYYIIANKDTQKESRDFFFSRVGPPEEAVKPVKPVEPVAADKPVKPVESFAADKPVEPVAADKHVTGVEPDGGFEPTDALILAPAATGMSPDKRVEPVRDPDPVRDVESIKRAESGKDVKGKGVEPVEPIIGVSRIKTASNVKPASSVKATSSEDLSESLQGNESSPDETANDGDVSGMSGSIEISGELRRGSN